MSRSSSHADAPTLIDENNLSCAWAKIFLHIVESRGVTEISPLVVSLSGFDQDGSIAEASSLRNALDQVLKKKGKISVEDVAHTIFPERLWRIVGRDRARLFALYKGVFPRYVAMNRRANGRGLYFERLTMFGPNAPCEGNQLEWILSQYGPGIRDTMFQAAIFDPARDHIKNARVGFPCLQHVTNAFYATQYVFDKAYGNYLGLAQLGAFMAHEMDLPFARLNVTVGVAKLDGIGKTDPLLTPLIAAAKDLFASPATVRSPAIADVAAGVAP
jgi:hypothetical protein